jgi:uncharacterized protein (DUF362 family)
MNVYMVTADRPKGIQTLFEHVGSEKYRKKTVVVKANFNSEDPFPASTHPDTLRALFNQLKKVNSHIILAERSGMGDTKKVLETLGVLDLVSEYGDVITLDTLEKDQVSRIYGEHWRRGFLLAHVFLDADYVIFTCCLKPHRFGGHFTLSLKNSVGALARYDPQDNYDYMRELHGSPHQRKMIAEINTALPCDLVILDAVEGFATMGPEQGKLITPHVLLASRDRVSIDVVGVALLRHFGATPEVQKGAIFEQEQIKRAVELGIGAKSVSDIKIVPLDKKSSELADELVIS